MGVWWEAMDRLSVSQTIGFTDKKDNGVGEEIVGSRSSSWARSGERFGTVRKALNLESRSLPRIGKGQFGMGYFEVCKAEAW